jgi:hypothetical protein
MEVIPVKRMSHWLSAIREARQILIDAADFPPVINDDEILPIGIDGRRQASAAKGKLHDGTQTQQTIDGVPLAPHAGNP